MLHILKKIYKKMSQQILVQSIIQTQEIVVETVNCDVNVVVVPTIQTQEIVVETVEGVLGSVAPNTFETVSKNLNAYPSKPVSVGGYLQSVTYEIGNGLQILKSFTYNSGKLINVALSGHLPAGIKTSKTFSYDGDFLSAVDYA
jgi:hypothetical protein